MKTIAIITMISFITGCSTHRVTLGEMTIYGSNEQEIPEPVRHFNYQMLTK
jgi:hypothetical protein